MKRYSYKDIGRMIEREAEKLGLDPYLMQAIGTVESHLDYQARRFEPGWKYHLNIDYFASISGISKVTEATDQATSWGALQVMGTVSRELGHQSKLSDLLEYPELAIKFGCKKMQAIQKVYENEDAQIAAYNAGSARKIQVVNGVGIEWVNQAYVNKVKAAMVQIRQNERI